MQYPLTLSAAAGNLPRVSEVEAVAAGRGGGGDDQGDGRNVTTEPRAHFKSTTSHFTPRRHRGSTTFANFSTSLANPVQRTSITVTLMGIGKRVTVTDFHSIR